MRNKGTQTIETARLVLRRFTLSDAEAMYRNWAADPAVTRYLRFEPHENIGSSREVVGSWLPAYEKGDYFHWAIQCKADGEVIGSLGILYTQGNADEGEPEGYSPGYCIGKRWWGNGYTTEALQAAMQYVAGAGVDEMHCSHAAENPASGRVMQKAGFVYSHDGLFHKFNGTPVPAKYYTWNKTQPQ